MTRWLCLVTDRRRLCPEAAGFEADRQRLVEQAQWAVESGIDLIQVRERDLETAQLAAVVARFRPGESRIRNACRGQRSSRCRARLWRQGVHLRHDSLPAAAVRTITPPGFLIGRSVQSVAEAAAGRPGGLPHCGDRLSDAVQARRVAVTRSGRPRRDRSGGCRACAGDWRDQPPNSWTRWPRPERRASPASACSSNGLTGSRRLPNMGVRRTTWPTDSPGDFGRSLREARERRGLSLRQIANSTKIGDERARSARAQRPLAPARRHFQPRLRPAYAVEVGLDPEATMQAFIARFPHDSVTAGTSHVDHAVRGPSGDRKRAPDGDDLREARCAECSDSGRDDLFGISGARGA